MERADKILDYWFGDLGKGYSASEDRYRLWFAKNPDIDGSIRDTFLSDIEAADRGEYDNWQDSAKGCLAIIILFDQFTRNIFRGTLEAFAYDPKALAMAKQMVEKKMDKQLTLVERQFVYLPFEHSEKLEDQKKLLELVDSMYADAPENKETSLDGFKEYAIKHYDIIKRFGRFPHRNAILGRESTTEEIEFLKQPGSSF